MENSYLDMRKAFNATPKILFNLQSLQAEYEARGDDQEQQQEMAQTELDIQENVQIIRDTIESVKFGGRIILGLVLSDMYFNVLQSAELAEDDLSLFKSVKSMVDTAIVVGGLVCCGSSIWQDRLMREQNRSDGEERGK